MINGSNTGREMNHRYKSLLRILCPKALSSTNRTTTLASLKQLLNEMPEELWEHYDTIKHRANHSRYRVNLKPFDKYQKLVVIAHLKQTQILTKYPFAAAINTSAPSSWSENDVLRYHRYQILVIVSCLQLYLLGGHECAIENALREIRLIVTDIKHMPVLAALPEITANHQPEQLIEALRNSRSQPHPALIERGIGFFYIAIYDAYRFAKGITRYRKSKKLPTQQHYVALSHVEKLDDTSVDIEELSLTPITANDTQIDETPLAEKHKTIRIYDSKSPHKSQYLQAELNKRVTQQLTVRQLSLPCSFEQATEWDIEHLVKSVVDETSIAGLWLLLSLVCGGIPSKNTPHRTLQTIKNRHCLVIEHQVPSSALDEPLGKLLSPTNIRIVLPLPEVLQKLDINLRPPQDEVLQAHLRGLNDRYKTRLTFGRVTRYLEHWFVNQGMDAMLVALLRGYDYKKRPALAYCNLPSSDVSACQNAYIEHVFHLANRPSGVPEARSISTKIGSCLLLPEHILHNLFNRLLIPSEIPKHNASVEKVITFHNQYVGYVWALLAFVTGHRDVTAPLGSIADFNPTTGTWWISDKENRIGLTARTLVIPQTAVQQIKLYLAHMQAMSQKLRQLHPAISARCSATLAGSKNLLFFIHQDQSGQLIPQDLSPKNINRQLGKHMPLQHNWARHHLRSFLHKSHLSPEVIDGWMGHENIGEEIFGHYSGLSIQALQKVASVIESQLNHHQIKALRGWQIH